MDADVITIEFARSSLGLLKVVGEFDYANELGPGLYDIHSPNVPEVIEIKTRLEQMAEVISSDQLWVNLGCGLKTRSWQEANRH